MKTTVGWNVILSLVETKHVDQYDASYKIWEWGNYCITETWKVWQEDPNPNEQARLEGRQPPKLW